MRGNNVALEKSVIPAERVPAKAGGGSRRVAIHECKRLSMTTAHISAATGEAARSAFPDAMEAVRR